MRGNIKWFDFEKGYGFAVGEDGSQLFLSRHNVVKGQSRRSLVEGALIEFDIEVVDSFVEALNSGRLRDADLNHRRPVKHGKPRRPAALRIRAVEEEQFDQKVSAS